MRFQLPNMGLKDNFEGPWPPIIGVFQLPNMGLKENIFEQVRFDFGGFSFQIWD